MESASQSSCFSRARKPPPKEPDRDKRQPYGKEHEDYSRSGVIRPPEEKVGKRDEPNPSRKP